MNKKMRYWIKVAAVVCVIVWSAVQIQSRITPQQGVTGSGYHWDILACEILLISGFYALLLLQGKERTRRRHILENRQVKAC